MTTPRVTVPVEPTEAMLEAAEKIGMIMAGSDMSLPDMTLYLWSAMLTAAPVREEGGAWTLDDMRELVSDEQVRHLVSATDVAQGRIRLRDILNALATREEAPAEAGEDVNWKAEYEAACAARISDRQKSQEVINERDKWVAELLQERAALRVQPPAREDAQPFMFAYEDVDKPGDWRAFRHQIRRTDGSICPGRALYTHPVPDALRVAVEDAMKALREARRHVSENLTRMYGHDNFGEIRRIDRALTALQAEQKGGA